MESLSLEEIRELAAGSKIPRVEGTLQAVYATKRGTSGKGPWRIQNLILAQGDDSMRVTIFTGPSVDKSMEGEEVAIMCSKSPKGGSLSGVEATDNDYNDQVTREIRMDRTSRIMLLKDAPEDGEAPPVEKAATANKAPVKASSAPSKNVTPDDAIAVIGKLANAIFLSREAVEEMKAVGTRTWTPDQVQASAGNIFFKFTDKFPDELRALPSTPMFFVPGKVAKSEPEPSDT